MATRGEKVVWDKDGKKQVVGSVGDAAAIEASLKKGDWNDYVIIAKGQPPAAVRQRQADD